MMKMINFSFNFEKIIINEAIFDQSLNEFYDKKMNSLPGSNIQYLVTFGIDSVQIRPNSLGQTKYRSYLHGNG